MGIPVFHGDPITGEGYVRVSADVSYPTDLRTYSGGRWYISNGHLIDTQDLMNPLTIGRQGEFTFQLLSGDRASMVTQTTKTAIEGTVQRDFLRQIGGTVGIETVLGTVEQFTVEPTSIVGMNHTWVSYPRADQGPGFAKIPGRFDDQAALDAAFPNESFTLATLEEAGRAAIAARLLQDETGIVDRYMREHNIQAGGGHDAHYNALTAMILGADVSNLTYHRSFILE